MSNLDKIKEAQKTIGILEPRTKNEFWKMMGGSLITGVVLLYTLEKYKNFIENSLQLSVMQSVLKTLNSKENAEES